MTTIFEKIIKGELPCKKFFENERIIAIQDIHPVAPVHVLIIPKKKIPSLQAVKEEDLPLIGEVILVVKQLAKELKITDGYRLLVNNGILADQTILHLHFHLIGGRKLDVLA